MCEHRRMARLHEGERDPDYQVFVCLDCGHQIELGPMEDDE